MTSPSLKLTLASLVLALAFTTSARAEEEEEEAAPAPAPEVELTPAQREEAQRKADDEALEKRKLAQVEPLMEMKVYPGGKAFDPADYPMAFTTDGTVRELDLVNPFAKKMRGRGTTDIEPVASLKELEKLIIAKVFVQDLTPIGALAQLRELKLSELPKVRSLRPLAKMGGLRMLWLERVPSRGLGALAELKDLEELRLVAMGVTDLAPLAALSKLRRLWLTHDAELTDISIVSKLPNLEEIHLEGSGVKKLDPLVACKKLRKVSVSGDVDITPIRRIDGLELERH